jgi:hypothetical protein
MAVEFEEDNLSRKQYIAPHKTSGMAGWLINHRLAKDEAGANKILIVLIIICFGLAAYFTFF